jgi:hypothetical protein
MTKCLTLVVVSIAMWQWLGVGACAGPVCLPTDVWCAPAPAQCMVPKVPKQITVSKTFSKRVAAETVLCRGGTRGVQAAFGPCGGPAIRWTCSWQTKAVGPEVEAVYRATQKARLVRVKTCNSPEDPPVLPKRAR